MKVCLSILFILGTILSSPLLKVNPETNMFIDSQGRERFFRGLNIVYKIFPFYPELEKFDINESYTFEDMEYLKSMGMNMIRLGVQWPGLEPKRGEYNLTYIEMIKTIVERNKQYGIYTLFDFHQDVLAHSLCGEGIPDWAVKPAWYSQFFPFPLPEFFTPLKLNADGVPSREECLKHFWSTYEWSFKTSSSYQALYDNVDHIQDSMGKFWREIAQSFKDEEYVLGFELINEPFQGNFVENPSLLLPSVSDYLNLAPMYENLNTYIRQADNDHIIFFEENPSDNFTPAGFLQVPGGEDYSNRTTFAFHYYPNVNTKNIEKYFQYRTDDVKRLKTGQFLTEYNICYKDIDTLHQRYDLFDSYKLSYSGWSYKVFGNLTGDWGCFWNDDGSKNSEREYLVSRTYPQAIAGTSIMYSFENKSQKFQLEYIICETCGETVIYLNEKLRYPNGFNIELSDESLAKATSNQTNYINITHSEGSNGKQLNVTITTK